MTDPIHYLILLCKNCGNRRVQKLKTDADNHDNAFVLNIYFNWKSYLANVALWLELIARVITTHFDSNIIVT